MKCHEGVREADRQRAARKQPAPDRRGGRWREGAAPVSDVLREPVQRFVNEITPLLTAVAARVESATPQRLRRDVVLEAFNLAAGFIDSDGRHTDGELTALAGAFSGLLDTQLAGVTPSTLRGSKLLDGRAAALEEPSVLFDILVRADLRDGTKHSHEYYQRALDIGFRAATIDAHTTDAELAAIERFRAALLRHMADAGLVGPGGRRPSPADGSAAGVAAAGSAAAGSATGVAAPPAGPPEDKPARPLEELLAELDDLVGLDGVKREVKLVSDLIRVEQLRRERGLPVLEHSRHLVFTGNPGTGKTTVARVLAQIYRTLGVVARGHLVETDRSQLVAGFVGQTAIQVRKVFDEAAEGVLLIDEAYALVRGGETDFGREAIDTIVKLVEDRRDSVVVIVAGYPDEMAGFVAVNPGLRSRFPKTIFFPDYTNAELWRIFELLGRKGGYRCDEGATARVAAWFAAQPRTKGFGNGRLARNLFEASVARQAGRVVQLDQPTDDQLTTLTADDIPEPGEDL
jgi:Cdc6-like AAA superfamily ATPase